MDLSHTFIHYPKEYERINGKEEVASTRLAAENTFFMTKYQVRFCLLQLLTTVSMYILA